LNCPVAMNLACPCVLKGRGVTAQGASPGEPVSIKHKACKADTLFGFNVLPFQGKRFLTLQTQGWRPGPGVWTF